MIVRSPRVGLTLKRYDDDKELYWMADYRYLTNPDLCKKMQIFIQLYLLGKEIKAETILNHYFKIKSS